jgi:HAD superfamily hydrolase (TIGR01549 family)
MKKYAHWVFDLDGTVINSSNYYETSIQEILRGFGHVPSAEDIQRAYRFFNPADYFATIFSDADRVAEAVQKLVELNLASATRIRAFAGIKDLLEYLRAKEIRLSAWTGRDLASAQVILKANGLTEYFSNCVSRTCVPQNKPSPDGLLKILQESKHQSHDVLMVGDHEYDMQGARSAAVDAISVGWDEKFDPKVKALSDQHFDHIDALKSWAKMLYEECGP